ncbi:MAG: hypothetical protein ACLT3E_05430 [Anaerovoracaceae bacterium]
MTESELRIELRKLNVPEGWYSINEGVKSDTYILNKIYYYWEFFFDERGGRNEYKKFDNENDACNFF